MGFSYGERPDSYASALLAKALSLPNSLDDGALERQGPRERAMDGGFAALGDADLIAILLGTGCTGKPVMVLAAELVGQFGGLEGLRRMGPAALAEHPGLGMAKALRIAASMELGRRSLQQVMRAQDGLRGPAEVMAFVLPRMISIHHEEMWVVSVDGRNAVRGARRVAQGGLHACTILPSDVYRAALADAASGIFVVHNHPSGDPSPSFEDLGATRGVLEAGRVVGIPLIDHVIVAPAGKYCSMMELGIIERG